MQIEPQLLPTILGFLGTAIIAGLGFILRTLNTQNQTLNSQNQTMAIMNTKLETAAASVQRTESLASVVGEHESRIVNLEGNMNRVWGIYDAIRNPYSAPSMPVINHHNKEKD